MRRFKKKKYSYKAKKKKEFAKTSVPRTTLPSVPLMRGGRKLT